MATLSQPFPNSLYSKNECTSNIGRKKNKEYVLSHAFPMTFQEGWHKLPYSQANGREAISGCNK
jgi:hypothetical protein